MGYFAGRSAPMGAVEPAVATATFYNFAPKMAARALPDAWGFASPAKVLEARLAGVDRAFGRIFGSDRNGAGGHRGGRDRPAGGREHHRRRPSPGGGERGAALADDPMLALWQATTILREHRGDGHVAALVDAGLDGLEAHISFVGTGAVPACGAAAGPGLERRGVGGGRADHGGARAGWTRRTRRRSPRRGRRLGSRSRRPPTGWPSSPGSGSGTRPPTNCRALLTPMASRIAELGLIPTLNPIGLPLR